MKAFQLSEFKDEFKVRLTVVEIQLLARAMNEAAYNIGLPKPLKKKTDEGFVCNSYDIRFKQACYDLLLAARDLSSKTGRPWYYEAEKQMLIEEKFKF